jgi:hypothetical protein
MLQDRASRRRAVPEEEWTLDRIGQMLEEVLAKLERIEFTQGSNITELERIIARLDAMKPRLEAMHADLTARLTAMEQRRSELERHDLP